MKVCFIPWRIWRICEWIFLALSRYRLKTYSYLEKCCHTEALKYTRQDRKGVWVVMKKVVTLWILVTQNNTKRVNEKANVIEIISNWVSRLFKNLNEIEREWQKKTKHCSSKKLYTALALDVFSTLTIRMYLLYKTQNLQELKTQAISGEQNIKRSHPSTNALQDLQNSYDVLNYSFFFSSRHAKTFYRHLEFKSHTTWSIVNQSDAFRQWNICMHKFARTNVTKNKI